MNLQLVGIVLLIGGLWLVSIPIRDRRLKGLASKGQRTVGTVVKNRSDESGTHWGSDVTFTDHTGVEHLLVNVNGNLSGSVSVLYDPEKPKRAVVEEAEAQPASVPTWGIVLIAGGILLSVGVFG